MKKLLILIAILFLIACFLFLGLFYLNNWYKQAKSGTNDIVLFEIKSGTNVKKIAEELAFNNLIDNKFLFVLKSRLEKTTTKFKVGEFELRGDLSPKQIVQILTHGKQKIYSITLIEGKTLSESIIKIINNPNNLKLSKIAKFKNLDLQDQDLMTDLNVNGFNNLEGLFLPETYNYTKNYPLQEILKKAHQDLLIFLDKEWQNRAENLPIKSKYEALILASIVEKETGAKHERPLIAGVFINRLRKGMRLQSDPTTIYGMGNRFKGNIRKKDLLEKTPYNTYRINGLPPTPICLVSKEAIRATLNPTTTKFLYFVAKGNGEHHFSETYKEHNRAVRTYQLK